MRRAPYSASDVINKCKGMSSHAHFISANARELLRTTVMICEVRKTTHSNIDQKELGRIERRPEAGGWALTDRRGGGTTNSFSFKPSFPPPYNHSTLDSKIRSKVE